MPEGNLPKRQYTDKFKIEAIRLAESIKSYGTARRLDMPIATVGNRKRK